MQTARDGLDASLQWTTSMAHDHPSQLSRRGLFQMMAGRPPDPDPALATDQGLCAKAEAAFAAGDMAGAAQAFRAWLRGNPGDDAARMLLGRTLLAQGRHIHAGVEFERVARRIAGHPAWAYLSLCRLHLQRPHKALEAFASWAAANPDAAGGESLLALAASLEAAAADPALGPLAAKSLEEALNRDLFSIDGPHGGAEQA
jgi:tetratricopeptide (TPR) repeat protein